VLTRRLPVLHPATMKDHRADSATNECFQEIFEGAVSALKDGRTVGSVKEMWKKVLAASQDGFTKKIDAGVCQCVLCSSSLGREHE